MKVVSLTAPNLASFFQKESSRAIFKTRFDNRPNSSLPTYTTSYGYDPLDDLTSVSQTDPTTQTTLSRAFQYDSLKRLASATNPELGLNGNGTILYSYDDSGNLAQRSDPRVTTTFSTYDGMNRVTGKSYSDGITPAVGYAYYPPCSAGCATLSQGRLMSVTSGALVNEYLDYDTMGRVTKSRQITAGVTYPFAYHYDQSGALASVKYPSGRVVTNTFDAAGRIKQVSGPSSKNYASQVTYAPQGAVQSLTLGNGIAETWGFNTRQQPTSLQALGPNASLTLNWGYGTDSSNNGNVMTHSITRSSGLPTTLSQTYQYVDPSNRLSSASEANAPNGWQQTYTYDAFGNRAMPGSYTPNPDQTPAALTEFTVNRWKRGTGDTYDGSGNQTGVATRANPGTSVNFFTYDGENRMVTSNVASMGTVTYSYDGEGRRVQKSWSCSAGNGTCTTVFVYDAMGQLAAEYATAPNPASGTEYLTADSLGSTRLVTDATGAVTQCYDYLPFGEEIPQGINGRGSCYPPSGVYPHTADATSRKFTGKERDVETGLDYFGARYMSAAQGRFTSPDWSATPQPVPFATLTDPQTLNLYAYVRNSPLGKADADGHSDYTWQKIKNKFTGHGYRTNAQVNGSSVAQTAASHRDSMDWATNTTNTSGVDTRHPHQFKPGDNKCNQFVGDTLAEAGKGRPEITKGGSTRMPTAHEYADPNVAIPGLSGTMPLSEARPGDVIAQQHGEYGHAGIVVGPNQTASVNTADDNGGKITVNTWGFRPVVPVGPFSGPNGEGPNGESRNDPPPVVRHPVEQ